MDRSQRASALAELVATGPDDVDGLRAAIERARERVAGLGEANPDYAFAHFVLGSGLRVLYIATDEPQHLDEAVTTLRQAVRACRKGDSSRPQYLTEYAVALGHRIGGDPSSGDVREAETLARQAADLTPADHPHRPGRLSLLAALLLLRAQTSVSAGQEHLDEALALHREAIDAAHPDDPGMSRYLRSYAQTLIVHAQARRDHSIAHEAEQLCYRAMRCAHPYDPHQRFILGTVQEAQALRGALLP